MVALLQMHVLVHRIGAGSKKPYLPGMDISGFVKAAPPGAADAGCRPACCLRWRPCALHLGEGHALLSSCHVPRAGTLIGHVLPERGRAACSKVKLGRLRRQAACAGA